MSGAPLILASASPRRKALLEQAGLRFQVLPLDVDESPRTGEDPARMAMRLAEAKAAAASEARPEAWVLAADTVVVLDDQPLGKPGSREEARRMLAALSGRTHKVITAFAVRRGNPSARQGGLVETWVEFRSLSYGEIEGYIDSGEAWDKAGAYGIQGRGAFLTDRIEGSYTNVVGLPLRETLEALRALRAIPTAL